MAAATTLAIPAAKVAPSISKALTTDLVNFRGRIYRSVVVGKGKEKMTFLDPVDVEVHVNPVTIGFGLLAVGAGVAAVAVASWMSGIGLKLNPEFQAKIAALAERLKKRVDRLAEIDYQLTVVYVEPRFKEQRERLQAERVVVVADIKKLKAELSKLRLSSERFMVGERERLGKNLFRIF